MLSQVTARPPPVIIGQREDSLNYIHYEVVRNFADNMSCSVEDIDRVIYVISPYMLTIMSIRVVLTDGSDYIFTCDNPDADGLPAHIAYTTDLHLNEERVAWQWTEAHEGEDMAVERAILYPKSYRVHLSELDRLPRSITKRIGTHKLTGDLIISLPSKENSFTKHHKDLVKIDRRRRKGNQEIYNEWDEIVTYYPVTVVDYAYPDEPIIATDDEQ